MGHHQFLTGFRGPPGDEGPPGPVGAPGPPGPPGEGAKHFEQRFAIPADVWFIDHGLIAFPVVTILDPDGQEIWADVLYLDLNALTITFAMPFAGVALLSA